MLYKKAGSAKEALFAKILVYLFTIILVGILCSILTLGLVDWLEKDIRFGDFAFILIFYWIAFFFVIALSLFITSWMIYIDRPHRKIYFYMILFAMGYCIGGIFLILEESKRWGEWPMVWLKASFALYIIPALLFLATQIALYRLLFWSPEHAEKDNAG